MSYEEKIENINKLLNSLVVSEALYRHEKKYTELCRIEASFKRTYHKELGLKNTQTDIQKLEAIQKIFHECTALDHSLVRAERFLTADGQSEIRELKNKAFKKIKDIVES